MNKLRQFRDRIRAMSREDYCREQSRVEGPPGLGDFTDRVMSQADGGKLWWSIGVIPKLDRRLRQLMRHKKTACDGEVIRKMASDRGLTDVTYLHDRDFMTRLLNAEASAAHLDAKDIPAKVISASARWQSLQGDLDEVEDKVFDHFEELLDNMRTATHRVYFSDFKDEMDKKYGVDPKNMDKWLKKWRKWGLVPKKFPIARRGGDTSG